MRDYKRYNAFKLIIHIALLIAYIHFKTNKGDLPGYFDNALIAYQITLGCSILNDLACISYVKKMFKATLESEKEKHWPTVKGKIEISLQEVLDYPELVMIRHCLITVLILLSAISYGNFILSSQWLVHEFLVYTIYGYARRIYV